MAWLPAAIIGASLIGGLVSSKGAKSAAETQAGASTSAATAQIEAAKIASEAQLEGLRMSGAAQAQAQERSIAFQQRIFDQTRADTAPWREAGANALRKLVGGTEHYLPKPRREDFIAQPSFVTPSSFVSGQGGIPADRGNIFYMEDGAGTGTGFEDLSRARIEPGAATPSIPAPGVPTTPEKLIPFSQREEHDPFQAR